MTLSNLIQVLAIAITLLLFLLPIVYFCGKLVAKLETIGFRLGGLEAMVNTFQKECFTKTDASTRMKETDDIRISMWKQIDISKKLARAALFKLGINPDDTEKLNEKL